MQWDAIIEAILRGHYVEALEIAGRLGDEALEDTHELISLDREYIAALSRGGT